MEATWRLPASTEAARLARHHVTGLAESAGAEVDYDALLVASELVTNAVKFGGPAFVTLHASIAPWQIRIAVHDHGDPSPVQVPPPDLAASGGRGLAIVAAVSSRWGIVVEDASLGKTVWAEIETTAG